MFACWGKREKEQYICTNKIVIIQQYILIFKSVENVIKPFTNKQSISDALNLYPQHKLTFHEYENRIRNLQSIFFLLLISSF